VKGHAPKPSFATVQQKLEDSSYLYELDKTTQEITKLIIDSQGIGSTVGDEIKIPNSKKKFYYQSNIRFLNLIGFAVHI